MLTTDIQSNPDSHYKKLETSKEPLLDAKPTEVVEEESLISQAYQASLEKPPYWQCLGILILCGAIIGGSSIGVLANYIPVQNTFAKSSWRSGINATLFLIPAILEYFKNRKRISYWELISFKEYGILLVTLVCQVVWSFGLINASLNTI